MKIKVEGKVFETPAIRLSSEEMRELMGTCNNGGKPVDCYRGKSLCALGLIEKVTEPPAVQRKATGARARLAKVAETAEYAELTKLTDEIKKTEFVPSKRDRYRPTKLGIEVARGLTVAPARRI